MSQTMHEFKKPFCSTFSLCKQSECITKVSFVKKSLLNKEIWLPVQSIQNVWGTQFKIFKEELHLPSPFVAKTGNLFWSDFPRFRFFVYQGGANRKDWSK